MSVEKPKSIFTARPSPAEFYGIQEDQEAMEKRCDIRGIRSDSALRTDETQAFLKTPGDYPDVLDFSTAEVSPRIDFSIVQGLHPWIAPNTKEMHVSPMTKSGGFGMWSGFGAVGAAPDSCYYFAIGNHLYYGGNTVMLRYDPKSRAQSVAFELKAVMKWKDSMWTDGKIHGNPDFDANGEMFVMTFSGPRPLASDLPNIDYKGGHLVRFNAVTGEVEDVGVPVDGETWCYSAYDGAHGILFAVGQARNLVLAYDTKERRVLYAGYPTPGLTWWRRCILVDRETGVVYSCDGEAETGTRRIVSWRRRSNTFTLHEAMTPVNPATERREPLRAHSRDKDKDGAFWCFDNFGYIFRFFPDGERIEPIGQNWGRQGKYTANLCMSPKGRYLYYLPGSHDKMHEYGTPVVQFDTSNGKKKVLAFLNDYYLETYGYSPYGAYGLGMDRDGGGLFFYTNGLFTTKDRGSGYGRPALFHLHIPESERRE